MTQIDFYVLQSQSDDERYRLASRIAEKAALRSQQVFIHTDELDQARRLDEILWTFSQSSFLPHRILGAGDGPDLPEPVVIGYGSEPVGDRWHVMINLSESVPEFFSRYERVAEVVDADAIRRDHGRRRYRFYRERGYELNTHKI
jgi:DNA polymerase-3 subunit chi